MKFYSINGQSLYMLVSRPEELDLSIFSEGMGIFDASSRWRLTPWAAVSEEAPSESLRVAEVILSLEGYMRINADARNLEDYVLNGDSLMALEGTPSPKRRTRRAVKAVEQAS